MNNDVYMGETRVVLTRSFYLDHDVVGIARALLGKRLVTYFDGQITSGIISETEAYAGENDRASHAWKGRRTARTDTMYHIGGTAYVYLCYGIHSLFNVVTASEDVPHAVLIRSVIPEYGLEVMASRKQKAAISLADGRGPGNVSKILGIHFSHTGTDLCSHAHDINSIWIEDAGVRVEESSILVSERIGVDYAGEDARLPYRFSLKESVAYINKKEAP